MLGAPVFRTALFGPWSGNALWTAARAVPSLDLCFADKKDLICASTGRQLVSFARASSGTYVDSAGVLQTAATDVPRFDHNPLTGESLGLLVEEQRTNLVLQSNAFTTTWQAAANTLTSASAVSPDGTTNGWRFADTAANSTHIIFQSIAWTAVATTFTVYAKYDTHRWIGARIGNTGNQFFGSWDLQNGVVGSFTAGATIGMQAVGNGWYRLTLTATLTSAGSANVLLYLNNADSASALTYAGTGTGSYIYGAQLEAGAFASSYIPTTTAAATRNADVAQITGTNFSSWYRQDEGTVYVDAIPSSTTASGLAGFDDTTSAERWRVGQAGATAAGFVSVDGNVVQINLSTAGGSLPVNISGKVASAIQLNNSAISANGQTVTEDLSCTMPTVTQITIGTAQASAYANARIRRLTYWPQRLNNATLEAITQS